MSRNQSRLLGVAARRVSFAQEILLRSFVQPSDVGLSLGWFFEPSSEGAGGVAGSASTGSVACSASPRMIAAARWADSSANFLSSPDLRLRCSVLRPSSTFNSPTLARLLECLLPFTGIAKRRLELRCELSSLLPKGLDFSGQLLASLLSHRGQPSIELASLCFALQPERQFLDLLSELVEFSHDSTTRTSSPD